MNQVIIVPTYVTWYALNNECESCRQTCWLLCFASHTTQSLTCFMQCDYNEAFNSTHIIALQGNVLPFSMFQRYAQCQKLWSMLRCVGSALYSYYFHSTPPISCLQYIMLYKLSSISISQWCSDTLHSPCSPLPVTFPVISPSPPSTFYFTLLLSLCSSAV